MSIEIVTHVWAGVLPHYAQVLRYHLTSPLRHPVCCPVTFRICYTPDDDLVVRVLQEFEEYNQASYKILRMPLELELLGRRHYGRDLACQYTKADVVWIADADYYWGEGCLTAAYNEWKARQTYACPPPAYYPRSCQISLDHTLGDKQISRATGGLAPDLDPAEFTRHPFDRPIGGTFIVDGNYAREIGYLRGGKWLPPWKTKAPPFASTRCDVCFRGQAKRDGKLVAVELPNLYRIRHSETTVCNSKWRLPEQLG